MGKEQDRLNWFSFFFFLKKKAWSMYILCELVFFHSFSTFLENFEEKQGIIFILPDLSSREIYSIQLYFLAPSKSKPIDFSLHFLTLWLLLRWRKCRKYTRELVHPRYHRYFRIRKSRVNWLTAMEVIGDHRIRITVDDALGIMIDDDRWKINKWIVTLSYILK